MTRTTERQALLPGATGTQRTLTLHRYGAPETRPKAYLQAALHADETPGLLVLHHLIRLLDAAAARGEITGQIVILPYANPIGLDQNVNGYHLGRQHLGGGGNFNRNWLDVSEPVAEAVAKGLGPDPEKNVEAIRAALRAIVAGRREALPPDQLGAELIDHRLRLAQEAADSDLVLDLHCDLEALMHIFLIPAHWPAARDIVAELGCRAALLAADSGGGSFDEAFSTPWTKLAGRFPEHPIPAACLSATVELRGRGDVSDELAAADAAALFRILQRRGFLAGDPGPLPEPLCEASPLEAVDVLRAPAPGVLAYKVALGERVREGDVVAEVIDPAAEPEAARTPVVAHTDGLVLSRHVQFYVTPGTSIAKVVGTKPLPHRSDGNLLED
ncbi:MAG: M14 family metallopeptidase [Kiloniellales bacterium]|nr:M14 family metallopeptidase [Kiloniellales bacterium]